MSKNIKIKIESPFSGIACAADILIPPIQITGGNLKSIEIELVPFGKDELEQYIVTSGDIAVLIKQTPSIFQQLLISKMLVRITYSFQNIQADIFDVAWSYCEKIKTILQLSYFAPILPICATQTLEGGGAGGGFKSYGIIPYFEVPDAQINDADKDFLETVFGRHLLVSQFNPTIIFMGEIINSMWRSMEPKWPILIFYYVTILEGLLHKENKPEITLRLALNSALLCDSPEEKKEKYNLVSEAYDIRSRVAHGSFKKNWHDPIGKKITHKLGDFVHKIIKMYLSDDQKLERINKFENLF